MIGTRPLYGAQKPATRMAKLLSEEEVRSVSNRTVHIKLQPTPKDLPEQREVLRVLERHGEVEMFKSWKYHPTNPIANAFMSIFASESSAKEIIQASPLRYKLISSASTSQSKSPTSTTSSSANNGEASPSPTVTPPPKEKVFELTASTSHYVHHQILSSPFASPLHGPWTPISPKRSSFASTLEKQIPPGIWSSGLKDWETEQVIINEALEAEDNSNVQDRREGGDLSSKRMFMLREFDRKEKGISECMNGLKGLKERMAQREEENAKKDEESARKRHSDAEV